VLAICPSLQDEISVLLTRTRQTIKWEIFFKVASPKRLAQVGSILLVGAGFRNDGVLEYHDFAFPAIMRLRSSPIRSYVQCPALKSSQRYSLFARRSHAHWLAFVFDEMIVD